MILASGCSTAHDPWHNTDIGGSLPRLSFDMIDARSGRMVSADAYRGKVTLLYFGYTYCSDACPTTLSNIGRVLLRLGPASRSVHVLFVSVDPDRDGLPELKRYAIAFGPQFDALRGDPDALAALARGYRVAYAVRSAGPGRPYEVTHGSGVYVFDRDGEPRLLISSLSTDAPDIKGTTQDLGRLLRATG